MKLDDKLTPSNSGFSLIELVVVISVLSIFSAIAIPSFICFQRRAKATAGLTSAINIQKECEISGSLDESNVSSFQPVNLSGYKPLLNSSFICLSMQNISLGR